MPLMPPTRPRRSEPDVDFQYSEPASRQRPACSCFASGAFPYGLMLRLFFPRSSPCARLDGRYPNGMALTNLAVAEEALSLLPAERAELAKLLIQSRRRPANRRGNQSRSGPPPEGPNYRQRLRVVVRRSFRQPTVKIIFSRLFQADLLKEETKYREISERLASAFRERVAGQAREVIRWNGGDHVGPHGFPCRRTNRFPSTSTTRSKATRSTFSGSCMNDDIQIF